MGKTHILSDETGRRMALALEALAGTTAFTWDADAGEYTNDSIAAYLGARRDGLVYGVSIPKGSATACTKTGANAGIANPVPGIVGRAAIDPYAGLGAFFTLEVNGYVDPDGTPHVTAIQGDGRFSRTGSNGNVWILAPVLYWRIDSTGAESVEMSISDSRQSGLEPQPHAYLPNGSLRPYMLYAKYMIGELEGKWVSASGLPVLTMSVSHNTLIDRLDTANTGYSGKSVADDWYVKTMWLVKYATKNSQSVMAGCTDYSTQATPTVAEANVTRVILANADAEKLVVGSSVMLGTGAKGVDRGSATAYDVLKASRIVSIKDYDADNKAVHIDAAAFSTTTTGCLSTAPWHTGACDMVEGDGSPTNPTSGKEPFALQGIELALGVYEVLGDVILSSDGSTGWYPYVNHDSRSEAKALTDGYAKSPVPIPSGDVDAWHYPLYPVAAEGLLVPQGDGASTSTGLCDGCYTNSTSTAATREWLSGGILRHGGSAGLFCVYGDYALASGWWRIGSRLSGNGRSRG